MMRMIAWLHPRSARRERQPVLVEDSPLRQLDPRAVLAARSLGASPFTAFRTITLPALRASITSAAAVVFVFCFSSLGVVLVLGDSSTRTLESQILRQTSLLLDFPAAAVSALLQIAVVSAALLLGARASMSGTRLAPAARTAPLVRPRSLRSHCSACLATA